MDNFNGQCSNAASGSTSPTSDEDVLLASSCPKKRAGRKKFKETRHPVYRGVRQRNGNRWVCEVRTPIDNSRIWLGTYPTAEMAARAHDVAALALRGQAACLNFADSAWRLPVPASTDARDIQRAAAEAGELFRQAELPLEEASLNNNNEICTHETGAITNNDNHESGVMTNNNNNNNNNPSDEVAYMDEEAVFNMPGLIDNMAQGLLLPPPSNSWGEEDDGESECDFSLWNH